MRDTMCSHDGYEACIVNPSTLYFMRPHDLEPMREHLRPVNQNWELIQEPRYLFVD